MPSLLSGASVGDVTKVAAPDTSHRWSGLALQEQDNLNETEQNNFEKQSQRSLELNNIANTWRTVNAERNGVKS